MTNIFDIKTGEPWAAQARRVFVQRVQNPRDELFIDFEQVLREPGTDAVSFTAAASRQVREVFWRYGLRRMPATWAELIGNLNYCAHLLAWLVDMNEETLARAEAQEPGRSALLRMLAAGDLDGAWRWHQAHNTFERNVSLADN